MNKSEKFWDRMAKNFDNQGDEYESSYIETITKYLDADDSVFEFACGTGSLACILANKVKTIHAMDISSKMIEIAQAKAVERNIENVNFEKATIFDERYANESFDLVLACNILHLVEDLPAVMQRISAFLKPGGIFISDTVCMGEISKLVSLPLALLGKIGVVPKINQFNPDELIDSIKNTNFQILEATNLNPSPPTYFVVAEKI